MKKDLTKEDKAFLEQLERILSNNVINAPIYLNGRIKVAGDTLECGYTPEQLEDEINSSSVKRLSDENRTD